MTACSSVVEHAHGKGGVGGSIPPTPLTLIPFPCCSLPWYLYRPYNRRSYSEGLNGRSSTSAGGTDFAPYIRIRSGCGFLRTARNLAHLRVEPDWHRCGYRNARAHGPGVVGDISIEPAYGATVGGHAASDASPVRNKFWQNTARSSVQDCRSAARHKEVKVTDSVVFTVATPFSAVPVATLTVETWYTHIQLHRPQLVDKSHWLSATLSAPTAVCEGTTDGTNFVFVNQGLTTGTGTPLAVFVNQEGLVDSAGFRRDFGVLTRKTVLWLPGQ
jgi:hypothetical protein